MPASEASRRCDEIIANHSLLTHPFYQAWNNGTLPVAALASYAREYGAFIETIPQGWKVVGEPTIAQLEQDHSDLWDTTFAAGLHTAVRSPQIAQVGDLVDASREMFAKRATALGALYAFEAQQPQTAETKLNGLKTHYRQLPATCGRYFEVHQEDYDEPALLAAEIDSLNEPDGKRAVTACERMSRALYDALTGIHKQFV
ncbi:MAG TPA: hypothetical protein VHM24_07740 [Gemmatimonadaceae bacterium]|nr:hypothetical protein [Gemmatimonadaceae bacterium]